MDTIVASSGTGTTIYDLYNAIDSLLTGDKFSESTRWQRVYTIYGPTTDAPQADATQLASVIYKGVGDGQDKIYFGMRLVLASNAAVTGAIEFNGYAGYDASLKSWEDQPGAIKKLPLNASYPCFPTVNNTSFAYWITATTKRVIVVVRLATQYMAGYFGFFRPVSVEKQYPYPLLIAGTAPARNYAWDSSLISSFTDPVNPSSSNGASYQQNYPEVTTSSLLSPFKLRKVDGTWTAGYNNDGVSKYGELNIFPTNTNSTELYTVYVEASSGIIDEPHVLFPFLLYSNFPNNLIGSLDGVYWIGGSKDIASENIVRIKDKDYIIFSNILGRTGNDYFAIEWE